jgi:hypothetical protein
VNSSPATTRARHNQLASFAALVLVAVVAGVSRADEPAALVRPLPAVDEPDTGEQQTVFGRIRLAALGDPQDLTEPLLPDDLAPPGQPRQEFEPPAGRKLPPGAKPGILQQAFFQATELPKLDASGLGLTTLEKTITLGMPCPTIESPLLVTAAPTSPARSSTAMSRRGG